MIRNAVLISILVFLAGCAGNAKPELTPLELQALQTRELETDKEVAFSSVMSVFQDLGYTVESADKETGFITAFSASDSHRDWLLTGNRYTTQTRATAFVESVSTELTRVRLNFLTGTEASTWYGQKSKQDRQILDPLIYQTAFEKIETAVFIRSE
ncbi:hypothetical protein [Hyphococcus sp.]|jgi:hypothetical protein|uniref:hypothetical protein n=1 Tax=Hyphococcus sp. TaxID=2038636 RepID=UPI003D125327